MFVDVNNNKQKQYMYSEEITNGHSQLLTLITLPVIGTGFLAKYGLLVDFKRWGITDSMTNIPSYGETMYTNLGTIRALH